MSYFDELICKSDWYFYKEGDKRIISWSRECDQKTLQISIDGGEYMPIEIENYIGDKGKQ